MRSNLNRFFNERILINGEIFTDDCEVNVELFIMYSQAVDKSRKNNFIGKCSRYREL